MARCDRVAAVTGFLACSLLALRVAIASTSGGPELVQIDGFESGDPGPGPTLTCPFSSDASGFFALNSPLSSYVVRLPVGYDVLNHQPKRLLVALHGCGDTALNFATWAAVPFALRSTQDYLAISIGGREGACWTLPGDAALVSAAIAHVRSCFYVNQRQIVLAGYSSGGMLAYQMVLADAQAYAGLLIENSGLTQAVGAANVDQVLDAADWTLNIAHTARIQDGSFPIGGVRIDRNSLVAHHYPIIYRELNGTHDGDTADWSGFLIPAMANWASPRVPPNSPDAAHPPDDGIH